MIQTPSHRRRNGRNAFYPDGNPTDHNPYLNSKAWGADMRAKDWLEGWHEAEAAYEPPVEDEAHARRSAAAADMLAALEALMALYDTPFHRALACSDIHDQANKLARAAIAKAKGD